MSSPLVRLAVRRFRVEFAQLGWLAMLTGLAGSGLVVTQAVAAGGSDEDIGGAGVLAVAIGSVVVGLSFSQVWAGRLRDVAQLRALGASRQQIRRLLLVETTLIGGIGAGMAVLFGYVAARWAGAARDVPIAFQTDDLIRAAVVALLACVIAGALAARKSARVSPVSLLRVSAAGPRRAWFRMTLGVVALALFVQQVHVGRTDETVENTSLVLLLGVIAIASAGPLLVALSAGATAWLLHAVWPSGGPSRVMSLARVELTRDVAAAAAAAVPAGIASMLMALPLVITASLPDDPGVTVEYNSNFTAVLVVIAVVVVAGLLLTAVLAIGQRRPVLGMLRAVGATRSDLWAVVVTQTLIGTGVGVLCGIAAGVGTAWSGSRGLEFVLPVQTLLALFLTIVGVAVVGVALTSRVQLQRDPLHTLAAVRPQ